MERPAPQSAFIAWYALTSLLLGFCAPNAATGDDVLKNLRPKHPRLLVTEQQFERLKEVVATDPIARVWHRTLQVEADKMLDMPPVERGPSGPHILEKSRIVVDRVSTLAGLYHIYGYPHFAERARMELLAVAAFPDWNPSHFLDVAEMTNAVAIGYDWLFDVLSADDKAILRRAIVEKGLLPGLAAYEQPAWWPRVNHNWNQVCNGGLTIGALAIADEEPELCAKIIATARAAIPRAMATFAPDGGWPEGAVYWNYATQYNVFYLAALETALGTDFGLNKTAGFAETGNFRIQNMGPTGLTFNFGDGDSAAGSSPQMFWLARTFERPAYDAFERRIAGNRPKIFHLLWFNPQYSTNAAAEALSKLPASQWFKGIDVALLRSDRVDANATFVGFKVGDNGVNHSHLDLGTFVLDALGQRWALDMGRDEYTLPGYFSKTQRWTYYRLRTEGHNTLTLDASNQVTTAKAPIIGFSDAADRPFAVADLTEGYRPAALKVWRGVAIEGRRQVLVQDEVEAAEPVEVTWNFHTDAAVAVDGPSANLILNQAQLTAKILSPTGAKFEVISANPPQPQRPAPMTKNLRICLPEKVKQVRIVVSFAPKGESAAAPVQDIRPLDEWIGPVGKRE